MFVTITTSNPTPEQGEKIEKFLHGFLPRLEKQPGVVAVYHFVRPDKGDDITMIVWENPDAAKAYRESELIKEALAFEKQVNAPGTREGYPLAYGTSRRA